MSIGYSEFRMGQIEVIAGSMFSGKTEELIRVIRRAELARQEVQVFKPQIDTRYSLDHVASHNHAKIPSTSLTNAAEIYVHLRPTTQVIGIDEAQFFDSEIVDVVTELANRGLRVIIAGLDVDWKGEPFHPMPELMAIAETVLKLRAVCVVCGNTASRTQRLVENRESILIGNQNVYEARCRQCFVGDAIHPGIEVHHEDIDPVENQDHLHSRRGGIGSSHSII